MKKTFTFTVAILLTTLLSAQNRYDALRYSQNFYEGSAKSLAMGNAIVSIGGDLGAISINPASAGLYRYSEFMFTPSTISTLTETDYLDRNTDKRFFRAGVSSFGFVTPLNGIRKTGNLKGLNVSVSMNKLNNFNNRVSAKGRADNTSWLSFLAYNTKGINSSELDIQSVGDTYPFYNSGASWSSVLAWNTNLLDRLPDSESKYIAATENIVGNSNVIGGPLDQGFKRETTGGISEYAITLSGNVNNKFYFGFSLGLQSLRYTDWQSYSEFAVNLNQFDSKFKDFEHIYKQTTTGVGINARAGVIYVPVEGLRLGASLATPTFFSLEDEWRESMYAEYSDNYHVLLKSPKGSYDYLVITPARANLGISYFFGTRGSISLDYEFVGYEWMRMDDADSDFDEFDNENDLIEEDFQNTSNIRAGAEFRLNRIFSLRAGYSFYQNPERNYGFDTQFVSCGAGFKFGSGFFADFGIQRRISNSENFRLYENVPLQGGSSLLAPTGESTYTAWKMLATIGFRF